MSPVVWVADAIRTAWAFLAIHWLVVMAIGFAGPLLVHFTRPNKGR